MQKLLHGEIADRVRAGGSDDAKIVENRGGRLFRTEVEVRAHGQLRPTWRRDKDRISVGRNIDCQTEVVRLSARVRYGRRCRISAATAGIDVSGRIETRQGGKAGVGGLRAMREPHHAVDGRGRRRAVKHRGEGSRLGCKGAVLPRGAGGYACASYRIDY